MNYFNESLNTCSTDYVKCFAVNNQRPESLADYVRRVRVQVKEFSLSEVERNSKGEVDASYVSRIENGQVKNVSPEKLSALAKGLQVPEDEIFAIARGMNVAGELPLDEVRVLEFYRSLPGERKQSTLAHLELESKLYGQERPREMEVSPEEFADAHEATTKARKKRPGGTSGRNSGTKKH